VFSQFGVALGPGGTVRLGSCVATAMGLESTGSTDVCRRTSERAESASSVSRRRRRACDLLKQPFNLSFLLINLLWEPRFVLPTAVQYRGRKNYSKIIKLKNHEEAKQFLSKTEN
jgi:hypothetical protein